MSSAIGIILLLPLYNVKQNFALLLHFPFIRKKCNGGYKIALVLTQASMEQKNNPYFAVIIRADKDIDYGRVITLIDKLKGSGITRFGLATDGADK